MNRKATAPDPIPPPTERPDPFRFGWRFAFIFTGALGIFSTLADFSRVGEARQLFTLNGFPGQLQPTDPNEIRFTRANFIFCANHMGRPISLFASGNFLASHSDNPYHATLIS